MDYYEREDAEAELKKDWKILHTRPNDNHDEAGEDK